jgi:D-lactate dehydrogenase
MRLTVFSTKAYDRDFLTETNEAFGHELVFLDPSLDWHTRKLAEGSPALCVFVNDKLDRRLIEHLAAQGLQLIALRCAGFNNVDLEAAADAWVKVVRVPAYSPEAVAEHALALILTLNRKTHKAYNRVREGNFSLERLEGFDIHGRTIGVIGTGRIGQAFCRIMQGFGTKVMAYDKYPNESMRTLGVEYVSLETLFAESHIISLHCPLTPETQYLIDRPAIDQMRPGVMLINTSRGGLIDTQAVLHGLKHRQIGYLGIDVYEQEEKLFFKDLSEMLIEDETISRLMTFPNVLITAHQAFFTRNALEQIAQVTLGNVKDFETGQPLENEVTAERVK